MEVYRGFAEAYIKPQWFWDDFKDTKIVMYIPEENVYVTEWDTLHSDLRYRYSFGVENNHVVLLIREAKLKPKYAVINRAPSYCLDWVAFHKNGGMIGFYNNGNFTPLTRTFDDLYPYLLKEKESEEPVFIENIFAMEEDFEECLEPIKIKAKAHLNDFGCDLVRFEDEEKVM